MGVEIKNGKYNIQHERALHRLMIRTGSGQLCSLLWSNTEQDGTKPTNQPVKTLPQDTSQRHGDFTPFFFRGHRNYSNPIPHFRLKKPRAQRGHVSCLSDTASCWQDAVCSPELALCVPLSVRFHFLTSLPNLPAVFV